MGVKKKKKKSKDSKQLNPEKDVPSAPEQAEAGQVSAPKEAAVPSTHKYAFPSAVDSLTTASHIAFVQFCAFTLTTQEMHLMFSLPTTQTAKTAAAAYQG